MSVTLATIQSNPDQAEFDETNLTPVEIVSELNKYVIAQDEAKKAVAIALRNRWRRLKVSGEMQEEITPKNIIMIGPTGVGKTEIARRLAKLARAPFVKIEATKFTEVGYVGRDVDSIIRDLVDISVKLVKDDEKKRVQVEAENLAEERLLDLLLPGSNIDDQEEPQATSVETVFVSNPEGVAQPVPGDKAAKVRTREKLREQLRAGKLEARVVEVDVSKPVHTHLQVMGPQGFAELEGQIKDMFSNMVPKQREQKKMPISEARKVLVLEAQENLIDHDKIAQLAIARAEQTGIVFIDEIDKICGGDGARGPDVSREGVQRDLLPLVEGSTVSTKYGPLRTDHVLFIASGAFHTTKPSDLMPEFQGRFPIRVELTSLNPDHFVRILTEPKNALIRQYQALLETEGVRLDFSQDAVQELSELTAEVNSNTENIGARRLHTLLEKLLEDVLFSAEKRKGETVRIDKRYVQEHLKDIVKDRDLSRFIL